MKRVLLFLLSLFIVTTFTVRQANAQSSCYPSSSPSCFVDNLNDAEDNSSLHLTGTVNVQQDDFINAITYKLIPLPNSQGDIRPSAWKNSLLGFTASGIAYAYQNQPANLGFWITDTGESLGFLPKKTYAQGVGFNGLLPLIDVWKAFRNIAYVLLSLAIIVVAFMIMFRKKIDPHTVISIQNALPRIIMVLITITFSYAIAGAMIDLMYVVLFASMSILGAGFGLSAAETTQLTRGFVDFGGILGENGLAGKLFAPLGMFNAESTLALTAGATGIGMFFLGPFGAIAGIIAYVISSAGNPGGLLSPLFWLIFAIILVFAFFRIFFMLLNAYIQILMGVLFAPIQLLVDVMPGKNMFVMWISNLAANLMTFVVVAVLLTLSGFVTDSVANTGFWTPPMLNGLDPGLFKAIVGMGLIMMIPSAVGMLKQALSAKSGIPIGIGSVMAPVGSAVGNAIGIAGSFSHIAPGIKSVGSAIKTGSGKIAEKVGHGR